MDYAKKYPLRNVLGTGRQLATRLNEADGAGKQRLVDLLERCRELPRLEARFERERRSGNNLWIKIVPDDRSTQLLEDINRRLARYSFRRQVQCNLGESPAFAIASVSQNRSQAFRREVFTLGLLLRLAEHMALDRIHRCPQCNRWFCGRPDAVCCSPRCTVRKHKQARRASGANAEYMRSYRATLPLKDRIGQLTEKQNEGRHLSQLERLELAQSKAKLAKLKLEYEKRRSHAKIKKA